MINGIPFCHGDRLHSRATRKSTATDAHNTFGYRDPRESRAKFEGRRADACNTVRYRDLREARAISEGIFADARNVTICRNCTVLTSSNQCFCRRFNQTISCVMVDSVFRLYRDAHKAFATREHAFTDACDTIRDSDSLESRAIIECPIADAHNTFEDRDRCESSAIKEGIIPDACDTIRDRDLRETRAITEGIIADARNAISDRDLREARAIFEGIRADARNTTFNIYLADLITIFLPRGITRHIICHCSTAYKHKDIFARGGGMRKESCDNVISRRPFDNRCKTLCFTRFGVGGIVSANADLYSLFIVGGDFSYLPLTIGMTEGTPFGMSATQTHSRIITIRRLHIVAKGIALGLSANRAGRGCRARSGGHIVRTAFFNAALTTYITVFGRHPCSSIFRMGVLGIELYQLPILRYSVHVCECACYVRSNFSNGRGEYHRLRVICKITARGRGSQLLCNIGAIYCN